MSNRTILVTDTAGFIGANFVKRIFADAERTAGRIGVVTVIGIDNMNDYYDVRLKEARLAKLSQYSPFKFIKGSIADKDLITSVFDQYRPSIVVNLAAQAGVRYSITNPDAYIESNLIGFYNILEVCRHSYDGGNFGVEHLVYASSSSVYGSQKRCRIPQRTRWTTQSPFTLLRRNPMSYWPRILQILQHHIHRT